MTGRRADCLRSLDCVRSKIKTIVEADGAALGTGASAACVLTVCLIAVLTELSSGCYPHSKVQNGSETHLCEAW